MNGSIHGERTASEPQDRSSSVAHSIEVPSEAIEAPESACAPCKSACVNELSEWPTPSSGLHSRQTIHKPQPKIEPRARGVTLGLTIGLLSSGTLRLTGA